MEVNRILIDTNFYSEFKRNNSETINIIQTTDEIYLNPVIMAELYSGFRIGSYYDKNVTELNMFLNNNPRTDLLPITDVTSLFYSKIFASLRKKGTPIPTNDIWIAASAMQHGLMLISFDAHFENIEGLLYKILK